MQSANNNFKIQNKIKIKILTNKNYRTDKTAQGNQY